MKTSEKKSRLLDLTDEYFRLERKLRLGGGAEKIEKIHKQGKLVVGISECFERRRNGSDVYYS